MYDCVEKEHIPSLITRIITGNLTYIFTQVSLQNLPLIIVNIVANTAQLMIPLFGFIILDEKLTKA
jgi:drug/metabolite transporter (DMT)-like permease